MKKSGRIAARVIALALVLALVVPAVALSAEAPQRLIVTYKAGAAARADAGLRGLGAKRLGVLSHYRAYVVAVPAGVSKRRVAALAGVAAVEPDALVHATGKVVSAPAQVLPWGVNKVEADLVWGTTTGDPIKVAVVDTGIDTAHPDLLANLKGGYSAVAYTTSYGDDNGHGTHVAGTIAAANNTQGVIGVAPNADLYGVKVLDRNGSGYTSDIIKGIDWAVANKMNVINMSLGGSVYSSTFDAACQRAIAAGVTIVAAAGNSGPADGTVGYPAKYAGVIGVSAVDSNNLIASFSSRGDGVDIAAPGVSIYSTYKGKTYATLSGTSMASPHVAGVAALVLTTPVGSDDRDADGVWDPAEVQARLTRTSQDLGTLGFDTLYGYGLVRADRAVVAQ